MPSTTTVFRWLRENEGFRVQYARAKEAQAELFADELIEIVDDASGDVADGVPNSVAVARARLRFDARRWVISKLLAKKYGDKMDVTGVIGVCALNERLTAARERMANPLAIGDGTALLDGE